MKNALFMILGTKLTPNDLNLTFMTLIIGSNSKVQISARLKHATTAGFY